jgi:hypothetical protein
VSATNSPGAPLIGDPLSLFPNPERDLFFHLLNQSQSKDPFASLQKLWRCLATEVASFLLHQQFIMAVSFGMLGIILFDAGEFFAQDCQHVEKCLTTCSHQILISSNQQSRTFVFWSTSS